ncbi:CYTH domain protein [Rubripirellula amarantea]|uniref:CYTH domain protein n=1 Tax=Rubripirellula amarantea TaxID=2527999 RepID=A0A5C5WS21_9BACT|nr:class IV adenylate cyclase [Rubripirellula amarantea]TWT53704.1 CYTH domain protein [Rubripirellula amarantea]
MFEVEQKFHVEDRTALEAALKSLGAAARSTEVHADSYFNHPARDFAQTSEALRVRRVNGVPMITYKGKKLPGAVKARQEMEWRLDPGDQDGSQTESLLKILSFIPVATVRKSRTPYDLPDPWSDTVVVIDEVEELGTFAEIEMIISDQSGVEDARQRITALGESLGLKRPESRSYLRMQIE